SKVVTPDSNSRTAPSGKVMLIMMFSLYWLSIISKAEVFPYFAVLNKEKQKATSLKGRRNVVPPSFMFLKKEGHL
ncbi:hypothetical protein ACQWKK_24335, partial [Salmonella enterica subsp. enterica serovar Infantis]